MLKNQYVSFRKEMATRRTEGHGSVIPITVRQLEAIVRISESLARMHLSEVGQLPSHRHGMWCVGCHHVLLY